jgi:glycosyltransferase involved in cell wall biosynthesis
MSRFSDSNRILYVEPSFSMARRPEPHLREVATNRFLLSRHENRSGTVDLVKPPRGIPKWTHPTVQRHNYRWFGRAVARAAQRLGFRDAIAWVYSPAYLHALDVIPHRWLVFDLVDDLSAYSGNHQLNTERQIRRLVERSDLLVVTAKTLIDRYGSSAARAVQVSNGFKAELFSTPDEVRPPSPLAGITRPILGFIGTLFSFLDYELLEHVARAHHDKSLVLVGPVETNAEQHVARLQKLPNVVHMGPQPQSMIPAYIGAFDVCLNPFRQGPLADSVSPLKVYEYLAMGRPVVSTMMEALRREDIASAIAFADGPAEFCQGIQACLDDNTPAAMQARRDAVARYSWQRLFDRLDSACAHALSE